MAALAHALLGIPSRCGLCRAVDPKDNYKLCVWGFSRAIAGYGISTSRVPTRKKEVGNLSGPWALNAADALTSSTMLRLTTLSKSPLPVTSVNCVLDFDLSIWGNLLSFDKFVYV
ncbi:hypothetical protein COP2_040879 [Malus domestica]